MITKYFRQTLDIDAKGDQTPVTVGDRETERSLRRMINQHFPDHGIYGEEFGEENTDRRYVWVLDPIDGTRSFITGTPTFGTLISLLEDGRPAFGVIDMPAMNEQWIGNINDGTFKDGQKCSTSSHDNIEGCRLVCTSPEMFSMSQLSAFKTVVEKDFILPLWR